MISPPFLFAQSVWQIPLQVQLFRAQFFLQHESLHYLQARVMQQVLSPITRHKTKIKASELPSIEIAMEVGSSNKFFMMC